MLYIEQEEVQRVHINHNTVLSAGMYAYVNNGSPASTSAFAAYAIGLYNGPTGAECMGNIIKDPVDCGFYILSNDDVNLSNNVITGQLSSNLNGNEKGGVAIAQAKNCTVNGGEIRDSAIGMWVHPKDYKSGIAISGINIKDSTLRGIMVQEDTFVPGTSNLVVGGISITGCVIDKQGIRLVRGTGSGRLYDINITGNNISDGSIFINKPVYKLVISSNTINAVNTDKAINMAAGCGPTIISNNIIYGPGSDTANDTYGIFANTYLDNPSVISNNVISGFQYGFYTPDASATLSGNTLHDVVTPVENVSADLGRDNPNTISSSVSTKWSRGQEIQNLQVVAPGTVKSWLITGPTFGYGNTKTISTTGDVTNGSNIVTNVADITDLDPGLAITITDGATGPADLNAIITALKFTYGTLTGTFEAGEMVVSDTSESWGIISEDNGSNTMYITEVVGTFQTSETLRGVESGATCSLSVIDLRLGVNATNSIATTAIDGQGITVATWT